MLITDAVKSPPYATLLPELILAAVESVGWRCSGSLLALNSYENRVYQVGIEAASPLIVKFYRPQRWSDDMILEEHRFALELVEQEIPVIAPWMNTAQDTLHRYQDFRFALFPRWGGRALAVDDLNQLEWIGRCLGRLHAIGAKRPFQHRPHLSVQIHGYAAYDFLIANNFIPDFLKTNYCRAAEAVLQKVDACFQSNPNIKSLRLHGDMHAGNILWQDTGLHIVDLDDCMMGPAMQDLWMLLSGEPQQLTQQLDCMLRGYTDFHNFDYRERHLIEPLRTLRLIHYSAWLARRWLDPAFPRSFPWFNTPRYWEE